MTEIPPDKARKFLYAAAHGMLQQSITIHEARLLFDQAFCKAAKRSYKTQKNAAPHIGISRNTISRILAEIPTNRATRR